MSLVVVRPIALSVPGKLQTNKTLNVDDYMKIYIPFEMDKVPVMFSIHLKAIWVSLTFLIEPGLMTLMSLHSKTPFFNTSKKLSISPEVFIGSPVISLIHSSDSAASSSLYLELICNYNERKWLEFSLVTRTLWKKSLQVKNAILSLLSIKILYVVYWYFF